VLDVTHLHQIEASMAVDDLLAAELHGAKLLGDRLQRQDLARRHLGPFRPRILAARDSPDDGDSPAPVPA
jgi:hypothetical protein